MTWTGREEWIRHGTLSLCAALDVKTGKVQGKTVQRHTSAEFIDFLSRLVNHVRWVTEIHIVLDNLSAHKTQAVRDFLEANPKVRFHFTPTYSSWLNQVEVWFSKIERDVVAPAVFTSVADLHRRWTYTDPKHRIRAKLITGTALQASASGKA
jgi:transposase